MLYEESLNTVLIQEVTRFNKLLQLIHISLQDLLKALEGLVVMSDTLESMSISLFTNAVPTMWANKAYPSLKPLGELFFRKRRYVIYYSLYFNVKTEYK